MMVRVFTKSASQLNEMFCSVSAENWNTVVRNFPSPGSVLNGKKRTTTGGGLQFPNGFPEK